jgi:hypothetical protein
MLTWADGLQVWEAIFRNFDAVIRTFGSQVNGQTCRTERLDISYPGWINWLLAGEC